MDSSLTKNLNVVVTGAAGQIAYSFLPMLCSGQVFGENVRINLRLLDIEQAEKALKGVVLELEDCAYKNLTIEYAGIDSKVALSNADVAVFLGGFPRKKGMERRELIELNGKIFEKLGKDLNDYASKDCKSVVIANPANTNCYILAHYASSIPKKNFSCLTRLDQNRAIYQLSKELKCGLGEISNVYIWGNHSSTQFPDISQATVKGDSLKSKLNNESWYQGEFIQRIQKRGAEIIENRGLSSGFSAASAIKDHLHDWYQGTSENEYVSMGIISDGSYETEEGLCFSFPVKCKGGFEYEILKGAKFDEFGMEKFIKTHAELKEEKNEVTFTS